MVPSRYRKHGELKVLISKYENLLMQETFSCLGNPERRTRSQRRNLFTCPADLRSETSQDSAREQKTPSLPQKGLKWQVRTRLKGRKPFSLPRKYHWSCLRLDQEPPECLSVRSIPLLSCFVVPPPWFASREWEMRACAPRPRLPVGYAAS